MARNHLHPIVEIGRSLWLITNWSKFEAPRAQQPSTILLRRLTRQEENLVADSRADFECWSIMITRVRKRLKAQQHVEDGIAGNDG